MSTEITNRPCPWNGAVANANIIGSTCRVAAPDRLPACVLAELRIRMYDVTYAAQIHHTTKFETCAHYVSSSVRGYINGTPGREDPECEGGGGAEHYYNLTRRKSGVEG